MTRIRQALPALAVAMTLLLTATAVTPVTASGASQSADAAGTAQDVSCATSTPPNTTVAVMAAPPAVVDENWSATEIQAASRCDVQVRETGNVAVGDTLVVRLRAPGLRDAVEAQAGENTTERFRTLVASDDANLTAEQTPETTSPMKPPSTLALLNGTRVVHSYEDTYYLVADTGNLQTKVEGNDGIVTEDLYGNEAYRIRLEHGGHVENDTVMIQRPEAEFSDHNAEGQLYREPAPEQTFTGTTTLAAGQNLTLIVSDAWTGETLATGSGETTLNRSDVRRFRATVNLSSLDPTTNMTVSVRSADGRVLAEGVPLRRADPNASVATIAAPPAVADENWSVSEIRAADRSEGLVRDADRIAMGDTIVVRLRALGLRDAVEAQAGENTTERFRSLFASDEANLTAPQLTDTVPPERAPLNLEPLNGTRVRHVYGDTFYVVADTSELRTSVGGRDGIQPRPVSADQGYRIGLELGGYAANDTVRFTEPAATFEGVNAAGRIHMSPEPGQTFGGPTTLAAGQEVMLTFREAGTDALVFEARGETTLNRSDDRRFEATVDLSSVSEMTNLTVTARAADGRVLAKDVPVRVSTANATVAVTTANASDDWGYVDATANLSRGGFLVLYAGGPGGTILDSSDFSAAGATEARLHFEDVPREHRADGTADLTVVAHRDADGDGRFETAADPAYDERAAADTATVSLPADDEPETTTTTTTATTTTTSANGTDDTATDGDSTDDESAGGDLPGFGVSAALVALVTGLAALARRR